MCTNCQEVLPIWQKLAASATPMAMALIFHGGEIVARDRGPDTSTPLNKTLVVYNNKYKKNVNKNVNVNVVTVHCVRILINFVTSYSHILHPSVL